VAQEVALEERVERHLGRTGPGQAVEQLEQLDAVGRERRDTVALGDPERRGSGGDDVRAGVHLREREGTVVEGAAQAVGALGRSRAEHVADGITSHDRDSNVF